MSNQYSPFGSLVHTHGSDMGPVTFGCSKVTYRICLYKTDDLFLRHSSSFLSPLAGDVQQFLLVIALNHIESSCGSNTGACVKVSVRFRPSGHISECPLR